jgi:hypothetical protein
LSAMRCCSCDLCHVSKLRDITELWSVALCVSRLVAHVCGVGFCAAMLHPLGRQSWATVTVQYRCWVHPRSGVATPLCGWMTLIRVGSRCGVHAAGTVLMRSCHQLNARQLKLSCLARLCRRSRRACIGCADTLFTQTELRSITLAGLNLRQLCACALVCIDAVSGRLQP